MSHESIADQPRPLGQHTAKPGVRAPFLGISPGKTRLAPEETPLAQPATVPSYPANALFGLGNEVHIIHRGERYHLRITSQGKLILTK